jgi:predicted ArsR family transcriptional regulator
VSQGQLDADVAGLASLAEPTRRALYLYVYAQDRPVSRDEAAAGVGVPRHRAKFHLDRLVDDGLLETEFARRTGRQGPGAGRPAKLYRPADREFTVSVPPRAYDLLARLLAAAVEKDASGTVRSALREVAHDTGRRTATAAGGRLVAALRECGYQPREGDGGVVELRNCPFHRLAQDHPELVCGLNLSLVGGIVAGSRRKRARAALEPGPDRCCVVVNPK